jgi:hypothetical protein
MKLQNPLTPRSRHLASVCMALALNGVAPAVSFDLAPEPVPLDAVRRPARPEERSRLDAEGTELTRRFAPVFVQDTSPEHPERDRPLRVDFDGDWDAENNWSHLGPEHARGDAAVYASSILTETHAYLTYTLFYPRDWIPVACFSYVCHDNDLESLLVVVERGGRARGPALVLAETKFHARYAAVRQSELLRGEAGQPLVSVESGGHGMLPARSGESLGDHPVRYVERSAGAADPGAEPYDLLPLRESLWAHRAPSEAEASLWTPGEGGFLSYAGARLGLLGRPLGAAMAGREFAGGVRPPWAIGAEGPRGDWFLDPAFVAVSRHGGWFGSEPSLSYVLNTYVDDLARECVGTTCSRARRESEASMLSPGGLLTGLGLLLLRVGRRPRRGSARNRLLPPTLRSDRRSSGGL